MLNQYPQNQPTQQSQHRQYQQNEYTQNEHIQYEQYQHPQYQHPQYQQYGLEQYNDYNQYNEQTQEIMLENNQCNYNNIYYSSQINQCHLSYPQIGQIPQFQQSQQCQQFDQFNQFQLNQQIEQQQKNEIKESNKLSVKINLIEPTNNYNNNDNGYNLCYQQISELEQEQKTQENVMKEWKMKLNAMLSRINGNNYLLIPTDIINQKRSKSITSNISNITSSTNTTNTTIPSHQHDKTTNNDDSIGYNGYWSPSTSDFDWCEYNYFLSKYIAEPLNSVTSLIYVFISLISMYYTSIHIVPFRIYVLDITFLTILLICIGTGSTLFHATLLYETQLLDELPMHWLVSYASIVLFTRNENKKISKFWKNILMTIFCGGIAIILWTTPKYSKFHQITRFIFAISFIIHFIYLFYVAAKCANQVYEKNPLNPNYIKINQYYDKCFISFTIALIGWLCDNFYCQILQNLKIYQFNIPYLHFHAFLWHIGTCIGLHYYFLVLLAHRIIFQYKKDIKCITICFGILPYIAVQQKIN